MECNRDEALRAKEIAEKKYGEKDIEGAMKFTLKAQTLFPGLDGISQMIATLDVLAAAETRINGEKDFYKILSLDPWDDEEAVKKQYRKLALVLHPDKNKSVGAEAAFKLVLEAFTVLSNKSKRMAYNHKRNLKAGQKKDVPTRGSSTCFPRNSKSEAANLKSQKSTAPSAPYSVPSPSFPSKPDTFWTLCCHCMMRYEYVRLYLNNTLLCPNCRRPFVATEKPKPFDESDTKVSSNQQKSAGGDAKNSFSVPGMGSTGFQHRTNSGSHGNPNAQFPAFSKPVEMRTAPNFVNGVSQAQASNTADLELEKLKQKCEEKIQAMSREKLAQTNMHLPKQGVGGSASGIPSVNVSRNASDFKQFVPPKRETSAEKRKFSREDIMSKVGEFDAWKNIGFGYDQNGSMSNATKKQAMHFAAAVSVKARAGLMQAGILKKEVSYLDLHNMLMRKARNFLGMKLEALKRDAKVKLAAQQEKTSQKKKQKQSKEKKAVGENVHDEMEIEESNIKNKQTESKECAPVGSSDEGSKDEGGSVNIDVPDPDFHDFDKGRSEGAFEPEQIWAIYDNEDGMPRFYALVQKVLCRQPFKICMSYLTSRTTSEFGSLNWVDLGFSKVCGDFRIGKYETCNIMNMFSHVVRFEKGQRGVIKILPRKGDVWALYRNWSPEWNEHTPDSVMYKYDMVEVLEDYNEEQGVAVTPLLKYPGFKTVFCRSNDPKDVMRIPKEEMLRFSHQVPSYLLTGEEAQNAPRGCHELDPAATPLELLQVTTESKQEVPLETFDQEGGVSASTTLLEVQTK